MAAYASGLSRRDVAVQTAMFAIGSTLMHSAACVLNDICDIEFDRKVGSYLFYLPCQGSILTLLPFVERCKSRPLPSGTVSVQEAWILLALLVIPAMAMLLLTNATASVSPTCAFTYSFQNLTRGLPFAEP